MQYNPYGYPGAPNYIQSGTSDIQGVPWVSTIDEVRSASVPFGKQMFMDRQDDVFYVKDRNGSIKAFSFKEIPVPGQMAIDPDKYVTKEEFEQLRSAYEQLIRTDPQPQQFQSIQPVAGNAADAAVPGNAGAGQAGILQPGFQDGAGSTASQQLVE